MPLLETKGVASAQGFGLTLQQTAANYIEDVFSTWLYTGNGSTQTITNGIDLAGKGGLVWLKRRDATSNHALVDTARGNGVFMMSNLSSADTAISGFSFLSNGFDSPFFPVLGQSVATWTFRKQPKFFDVVTFTTAADASATVNHTLASTPGFVVIKRTDNTGSWLCWHRGLTSANYEIRLNTTGAETNIGGPWLTVSSTQVVFPSTSGYANLDASAPYVMYLFAHDAGGFGLTGTDNVISCGSFQDNASGTNLNVTLGYEPQWLLVKAVDAPGSWLLVDSMRSFVANPGTNTLTLYPNLTNAEATWNIVWGPTATGFQWNQNSGRKYIYIAIRRGPMKTPTTGTSVFSPALISGTGSSQTISSPGFAPDLVFGGNRSSNPLKSWVDKLRGRGRVLQSYDTSAEASSATNQDLTAFLNTGFSLASDWNTSFNTSGSSNNILWTLQRAPGFFDVVCFDGSNSDFTVNHNLQSIPELIFLKRRNGSGSWFVGGTIVGFNASNNNNNLSLNNTDSISTATVYTSTWTSTQMFMSGFANFVSGNTVVGYLFATCPGVSKVGSYTGNGSSQTIDMGFTGGARFFLVKRTNSTGDWWVYDSARGIVSANDPALALNNTNAEVTSADAVDATSVGLIVNQESTCNINVNGGTYIYLAIA